MSIPPANASPCGLSPPAVGDSAGVGMGISVGDDCAPALPSSSWLHSPSLSSELSSWLPSSSCLSVLSDAPARKSSWLMNICPGGVFARMSTGGDLCVDREENSPYRASLSFVARTAASVTRALCDLRLIPVQGIAAGNYSATVRKLWLGPKSLLPPLVLNIS